MLACYHIESRAESYLGLLLKIQVVQLFRKKYNFAW